MTPTARAELVAEYDRDAAEYCRRLPLEHFMEAPPQATQRAIFTAAFEQIRAVRPDVQHFSELLIQYEFGDPPRRRRVVPDNMVVVHPAELEVRKSYPIRLHPLPLLVLEYVSKENDRKDYQESHEKYEQHLRVPYYLQFYPEGEEMTLFGRGRRKYASVRPNREGRYAIPEIEVEAAIHEGWVRFWFRGEMMPRPAEMRQDLIEKGRAIVEKDRAIVEKDSENARLRAQLAEAMAALSALRPPAQ